MAMRITYLFLLVFLSATYTRAQDPGVLESTKSFSFSSFRGKDGRNLGCGSLTDCHVMVISVYEANIDIKKKTFRIRGRVIGEVDSDTAGVNRVDIILATPSQDSLTKIRPLTNANNIPLSNGEFVIESSFGPEDRLYFVDSLYYPIEYNIGELLEEYPLVYIDFGDHFRGDLVSLKFEDFDLFSTLKLHSDWSDGYAMGISIYRINDQQIRISYPGMKKTYGYSARKSEVTMVVTFNGKDFKYKIDLSKGIFVRFDNSVKGLNFYQRDRPYEYD